MGLIRDYENSDLPMERRVPSLARRFECLEGAEGLDPWSAETFYAWVGAKGEGTAAWHAGHLILNLFADGEWGAFDAVAAIGAWSLEDRAVFATWVRSWK